MIVIPDVHGRTFWKDAVRGRENEEIIFLGDYVDPYVREGSKAEDGLTALQEVIEFKKQHPHNVTLLLGNHDLGYIIPHFCMCRHDYRLEEALGRLFAENASLFAVAHEATIGGKRFLFTHAGLHPVWVDMNRGLLADMKPGNEAEVLNRLYTEGKLNCALDCVAFLRGGYSEAGSIVWADRGEFRTVEWGEDAPYQVFGHTQDIGPFVTEDYACLDCRQAFTITGDGKIRPI